MGSGPGAMIDI